MPLHTKGYRLIINKRDFVSYLAARLIGTLGMQMQSVAIGWQVYDHTKNPMDLGLIGLMQFLPVFSFSLFAGQLADRVERHTIVWACHAIMSLCCFALFFIGFTDRFNMSLVYGVLFIIGTGRAFLGPSSQAFFPNLVEKNELGRAIAMNTSIWQFAVIFGPSLGGIFYALSGKPYLVYLTSSFFLATSATLVFTIKVRSKSTKPIVLSITKDIWAGINYIRARKEILGATTLDLFAVLLGGATALLPAYTRDVLHTGPEGLGLLRSAPAIGAAVTGTLLSFRPIKNNVGKRMFFAVAGFGLCTVIFGLSTQLWLSWIALLFLGAFDVVSVVTRQTLIQLRTPSDMRGRVSAVNSIFIGASNELGEFESGVTAAWFGLVPAVVFGGIATCVVTLLWSWKFPELRKLNTLEDEIVTEKTVAS